jgi:probable selenate reductase FAD-binding subunit
MVSEILRPRTVSEAARLAAKPGAVILGGGTVLNSDVAAALPADQQIALVSLQALGLDFVEWRSGALRLGAAATFQQCLDAPGVPRVLRDAFGATASRTLRSMITIGGELGHCPADSVLLPVLAALEARVHLAGGRVLAVDEYRAARAAGPVGLIVEVTASDADRPCAVAALARTSHGRRSLVIAVAAAKLAPKIARLRIVASDCRGQQLRLTDAEDGLEGSPLPEKERIEKLVRAAFWPTSDILASTEFKRYLAGAYVADLLHDLAGSRASS